MSFYTSLHFYRPTQPPIITGPALAAFIRKLDATGLLKHPSGESLRVKFGTHIDQDDKDTSWEEPIPDLPGMSKVCSIDWDIDQTQITLPDMLRVLEKHDQPLYRVETAIGTMTDEVVQGLQTARPDDGQPNLCLWDVHLSISPVSIGTLNGQATFSVGWISLSMSGNGYLFPWSARDLTDRADRLAALDPLKAACRSTWPVLPDACPGSLAKLSPTERRRTTREIRQRMGAAYPHDDLDRPWNWAWGVEESG